MGVKADAALAVRTPSRGRDSLGVLLLAHGGPASLDDVPLFLTRVRGRAPSAELVRRVSERYEWIGGASPAPGLARSIAEKLRRSCDIPVYAGMLNWHPVIEDVIGQMAEDERSRALAICLVPHFSAAGVGSYHRQVVSAARSAGITFDLIGSWHAEPAYIGALADSVALVLSERAPTRPGRPIESRDPALSPHIIFTAHSLPKAEMPAGDPYESQLLRTAEMVADRLDLRRNEWTVAFQSISGSPQEWLGPSVQDVLAALAVRGTRRAVLCPFGFVLDQVEILYDLDHVLLNQAKELGVELRRTPTLNDSAPLIATLSRLVERWKAEVKGESLA